MGDPDASKAETAAADTLWERFVAGEPRAQEHLLAQHYDEVRRIARRVLGGEGDKLQLQPTELANEAALRVLRLDRVTLRDRAHFLALSARVMRQVLLDEVRKVRAAKRAPPVQTHWSDPDAGAAPPRLDIEAFDESLKRLAEVDPERARVVELRFYVGLTLEEVAEQGGQSLSTVKRRWRTARAWLLEDMGLAAPAADAD